LPLSLLYFNLQDGLSRVILDSNSIPSPGSLCPRLSYLRPGSVTLDIFSQPFPALLPSKTGSCTARPQDLSPNSRSPSFSSAGLHPGGFNFGPRDIPHPITTLMCIAQIFLSSLRCVPFKPVSPVKPGSADARLITVLFNLVKNQCQGASKYTPLFRWPGQENRYNI
jgi:hypothetical protein